MRQIEVKLRKDAIGKTIVLRLILYAMLLFSSVIALYILESLLDSNIKYILYAILLVLFAFFFQYLIYAKSLGKRISLSNFKDTILEKVLVDNIKTGEMDHPIKFLFPEIDLFYKLDDSIHDKIDLQQLNEIADLIIDKDKALKIETEFSEFIHSHLEELLEYDVVIKMKRKGKALFDDLVEKYPKLEKLIPFTDPAIRYYIPKIKGRKILIFDDSIHKGQSAKKIIELLKSIGYDKILFLTIIAQKSSLDVLEKKYPKSEGIQFLQFKVCEEESYLKFYEEYMFGYLDSVNRSLENDHFLVKMKIDRLIDMNQLMSMFDKKDNYVYEVERFVDKKNEYKISVECPSIYYKMKNPFFKKIKMDMVKVRFFVKLNQQNKIGTTDITLSPILMPREFSLDCDAKYKNNCSLNKNIEEKLVNLICINCLIRTLTNEFITEFIEDFNIELMKRNIGNIVDVNISSPFPQEIYDFENK